MLLELFISRSFSYVIKWTRSYLEGRVGDGPNEVANSLFNLT